MRGWLQVPSAHLRTQACVCGTAGHEAAELIQQEHCALEAVLQAGARCGVRAGERAVDGARRLLDAMLARLVGQEELERRRVGAHREHRLQAGWARAVEQCVHSEG